MDRDTLVLPWMRLALGLLQGLLLACLYQTNALKAWPATDGFVFAPVLTVAIFIPTLIIAGAGNLRARTLIVWATVATLLCVGLALYDIYRDPTAFAGDTSAARTMPSAAMWFSAGAALFIVHALIVAGEGDLRAVAKYPTLFEVSWKHGLQIVLATAFVAVLWLILYLGAELFRLIRIEFLAKLIQRQTFSISVTAVAFSYAIHVTDVRASVVRGTQTLILVLLSWLLPLMALLAAAFITALPFTGLEPLWATRRATAILLIAAAALVFLVNAAYQHGRADYPPVAALRYAGLLAAAALVPLVALAAYGLSLRIGQYGFTPERVYALAAVAIAGCYALGYVVAAVRSGPWMRGLEQTNVLAAIAIVAVLLVLASPVADPQRISVANQVGRLLSGKVSVEQFDFAFLRFRAGRYGAEALARLAAHAEGPRAADISRRASEMLAATNPSRIRAAAQRLTPEKRAANIKVIRPSGATLPERFVQQDWNAFARLWLLPQCLVAVQQCEAVIADLGDEGRPDILLFSLGTGPAAAFKEGAAGDWDYVGPIANANCTGAREALREGRFKTVRPQFNELEADGQRLRVNTECAPR